MGSERCVATTARRAAGRGRGARRSEAGADPPEDGDVVAGEAGGVAVGAEGAACLSLSAARAAAAKDRALARRARPARVARAAVLARSSAGSAPFAARPADALVAPEVAAHSVAARLIPVATGTTGLDARVAHAAASHAAAIARAAALAQVAARRTRTGGRALTEAVAERGVALAGLRAHAARPRGARRARVGCVDGPRAVAIHWRVAARRVEVGGVEETGRVDAACIRPVDDRRARQRAAHRENASEAAEQGHDRQREAHATSVPSFARGCPGDLALRMGPSPRVFVRAMLAVVLSFLEVFLSNLFDAVLDAVLKIAPKWAFWPILAIVTAAMVALVYWFFG